MSKKLSLNRAGISAPGDCISRSFTTAFAFRLSFHCVSFILEKRFVISTSGQSIYLSGRYRNRFSAIFSPSLSITRCRADLCGLAGETNSLGSFSLDDVPNGPIAIGEVIWSRSRPNKSIKRQFSLAVRGRRLSFIAIRLIDLNCGLEPARAWSGSGTTAISRLEKKRFA